MILIINLLVLVSPVGESAAEKRWWDEKVEASIGRIPERRRVWEEALARTEPRLRPGTAYLLRYLPEGDLKTLEPKALLKNVELAERARREVPWGKDLPEEVFLDAVLPHASLTEPRDSSREEFQARYLPLAKACSTPGEAALRLNERLFKDYKVVYDTRRSRTDQSSRESIAQGMATCTGLSIMLVEACRSAGIPARAAGIHSWPGRGGNHTWVEIWDRGDWHYVGAGEPDPNGLDHAWFSGEAAKAIEDRPLNAVFAARYRTTGVRFPLAWNPVAEVPGENVTARYRRRDQPAKVRPRLMVEARENGERIVAEIVAIDRRTGETRLKGASFGTEIDVNRHLSADADEGESFVTIARKGPRATFDFASVRGDTVVRLDLDSRPSKNARDELTKLLEDRFGEDESRRDSSARILAEIPFDETARSLAWTAYVKSPRFRKLREELHAKIVATKDRTSPYLWRHVGEKPKDGWALVIALHGGGGAPKEVNDRQWHAMFDAYYREHPEAGGYVYLALRAPNDQWNGFYDDAICPLIERLIRQFTIFEDVNPDKVYLLGASHGGYGAFVIGPKMPDRFAAIHASASAQTPGETRGENLRDVRFTFMIGEKDTAYGRADRCREFADALQGWKKKRGGYPGGFEWRPGVGHHVPDRDKVAELLRSGPRDPWPKQLVWIQSDDILHHFYWVEAVKPVDNGRVEAKVVGNAIDLKTDLRGELFLWLDSPLLDLSEPATLTVEGEASRTYALKPVVEIFCLGLDKRGDPRLAAPVRIRVELPKSNRNDAGERGRFFNPRVF